MTRSLRTTAEQGALLCSAAPAQPRYAGRRACQPGETTTPYINTIPKHDEAPYPGDRQLERRIEALLRWNAMAMVHKQNKYDAGIGGHISTYSSGSQRCSKSASTTSSTAAIRLPTADLRSPATLSTSRATPPPASMHAYLLGRFDDESRLKNFRHELRGDPGLSSYPHPWLMKDFWQFPTVSMGIGPLNAIYQARFMKYLENRGLIEKTDRKVWAFVGDGETDEVDTLGAINLGSREKLDNLIFVVNCNLQRLDGPVRGNGRIIDELEATFRGAGWNVIKVIWGSDWDALFAQDHQGLLLKRMEECVDGDYQRFKAKDGAYLRKEFFGKYPELLKLVEHLSDDELFHLHRGGHDALQISLTPTSVPSSIRAAPRSFSPRPSRATASAQHRRATLRIRRRNSLTTRSPASSSASIFPSRTRQRKTQTSTAPMTAIRRSNT